MLPRFALKAYPRQHAIRGVGTAPQVIDSLRLIFRAEWPLSAAAAC